jgi:branched-chain amino acid aminotransferase
MINQRETAAAPHTIRDASVLQAPDVDLDPTQLQFGRVFCPNMFITEYADGRWNDPRIEPLRALPLHPGSVGLHYGQAIFEGLKAFRHPNDRIAIFRPDANARRLNRSAEILDMPAVPEELFIEAIRRLVSIERRFVPEAPGSLYIRPTMIASEPCLSVASSKEYLFYILVLPTGSYFKETASGAGSVKVMISDSCVRAVPGGTGAAKAAGNYAATLRITSVAKSKGCSQVLFLNAVDRKSVEEMGGMNVFFVRDGGLVTPPLTDTILRGTIRDSIIACARDLGLPVEETRIDIDAVLHDITRGSITEAIACGTAAALTGISAFVRESGDTVAFTSAVPGPVTTRLFEHLQGIQYGRRPDTHGWLQVV